MACSFTTATKHLDSSDGDLEKLKDDEIVRYVAFVPVNGLSIRVCSNEGRVAIFVFYTDHEHSGILKPVCENRNSTDCDCVQVYIPEFVSSSKNKNRRRARRETTITEVQVTIEGMERENLFVIDIYDGDDPNDCVGVEIASDCIIPKGYIYIVPFWHYRVPCTAPFSSDPSVTPSAEPTEGMPKFTANMKLVDNNIIFLFFRSKCNTF